jgi:hypothetical protein
MPGFFKPSCTWVVDFRFDGHARRWFKVAAPDADLHTQMQRELARLYGPRAQLEAVRHASDEEEAQYLRGEEPKNLICPTGR